MDGTINYLSTEKLFIRNKENMNLAKRILQVKPVVSFEKQMEFYKNYHCKFKQGDKQCREKDQNIRSSSKSP